MEANAFAGRLTRPSAAALAATLGVSFTRWNELRRRLARQYAPLTEEWVCSGASHGWSLRLKQKQRAVLYLGPRRGCFLAALVLGEKAVRAASQGPLPARTRRLIALAPRYPEGRAVRVEIRSATDLEVVERLAALKMAN